MYLITGATGTVGRPLLAELRGHAVRAVTRGPESLTHEQLVATIARVLGRDLRFTEVPPAVAAPRMVEHGQRPELVAALMAGYERENGRPAHVSGDVEKVLGRPGRTFADWVADHADLFGRSS